MGLLSSSFGVKLYSSGLRHGQGNGQNSSSYTKRTLKSSIYLSYRRTLAAERIDNVSIRLHRKRRSSDSLRQTEKRSTHHAWIRFP